jgi:Stage II sporulation protein E (SpoIIE)
MIGTGSRRAGRASSPWALAKARTLQRCLTTVEDELQHLVELNRALLHRMVDDPSVPDGVFAAKFDRTDPAADGCKARRPVWKRTQGDFYLVRRLGHSIYFVVGDATGHHAHAAGLKLFAVTALVRMFEEFASTQVLPEPIEIVTRLDEWFSTPKNRMLKEAQVTGGANIIVVRIDARPEKAVAFASAGLPAYSLGERLEQHGSFGDFNGVGFRSDRVAENPKRQLDKVKVEGVGFLAVVTDGFRSLGRRSHKKKGERSNPGSIELFRDHRVNEALRQGYGSLRPDSPSPALRIAEALTEEAKRFRRGFYIPEDNDDDRLVLVVDLDAIWRSAPSVPENVEPLPLVADAQSDVVERRKSRKISGN